MTERPYRVEDLTGQTFNRLTVISQAPRFNTGRIRWNCICSCGNKIIAQSNNLKNGRVPSCGCNRSEIRSKKFTHDLTGQVFGRLTVIDKAPSSKHWKARWLCRCTCGNEKIIQANHLKEDATTSCGCFAIEQFVKRNLDRPGYISKSATSFLDKIEQYFNIHIEREFPIKYRYFDGRYKHFLIEVDGEYWHSDPNQKQIDTLKDTIARESGFTLIRCIVNNLKEVELSFNKYLPNLLILK